jgi:drug/metabolite transporter (DMT)-like permease
MQTSISRPAVSPLLAILFGVLATATASILIRYAQRDMPSLVIAAYRLSIASLVLTPIALTRHRSELRSLTRVELKLSLLSGVFLAIHFATWITSLSFTSVASSVVLVSSAPLWVALLAPISLKESFSRWAMVGLVLALLGSTIVGLSDTCTVAAGSIHCPPFAEFVHGSAFLGDLLALAGGLAAAAYLLVGRRLRGKMSLIPYIFLVYGMGAVVLVAILPVARETPVGYPPITYLWLVLLALLPQLVGHTVINWALRFLSAAFVAITMLGEPIGSTILAFALLGETPSVEKIFGAILILLGIYLAALSEAREM